MTKPPIRVILEALADTAEPTIVQVGALYPLANRVLNALIAERHLPVPSCRDCGVAVGEPHDPGCDVARCKDCGWQDIGGHDSECPQDDDRPSTIWTGQWPGEVEVEEGLATDLNDLGMRAARGQLRWDRDAERWVT